MYPVSLGLSEARNRISRLIENGHHAEALVTSVFTFEKTVRRGLRYCAVRRGFTSKQADILFDRKGFADLKELWPCFSPSGESLAEFIGHAKWEPVPSAVSMRNKLVHGERAYKRVECRLNAERVIEALDALCAAMTSRMSFDGWSRLPVRRVSALPWMC